MIRALLQFAMIILARRKRPLRLFHLSKSALLDWLPMQISNSEMSLRAMVINEIAGVQLKYRV